MGKAGEGKPYRAVDGGWATRRVLQTGSAAVVHPERGRNSNMGVGKYSPRDPHECGPECGGRSATEPAHAQGITRVAKLYCGGTDEGPDVPRPGRSRQTAYAQPCPPTDADVGKPIVFRPW